MFGGNEVIVILVIALLLFGGTQIPKLARSLGRAQTEFKKGLGEGESGEEVDPEAVEEPDEAGKPQKKK
jgi:sec-independent protein translocase protein TatA